jgi:hypothetical protein
MVGQAGTHISVEGYFRKNILEIKVMYTSYNFVYDISAYQYINVLTYRVGRSIVD